MSPLRKIYVYFPGRHSGCQIDVVVSVVGLPLIEIKRGLLCFLGLGVYITAEKVARRSLQIKLSR